MDRGGGARGPRAGPKTSRRPPPRRQSASGADPRGQRSAGRFADNEVRESVAVYVSMLGRSGHQQLYRGKVAIIDVLGRRATTSARAQTATPRPRYGRSCVSSRGKTLPERCGVADALNVVHLGRHGNGLALFL